MAHETKVIRSINLEGETNCVDIFRRPEASFGFDASGAILRTGVAGIALGITARDGLRVMRRRLLRR